MDPLLVYLLVLIVAAVLVLSLHLLGEPDVEVDIGESSISPFSPTMIAIFAVVFSLSGLLLTALTSWVQVAVVIVSALLSVPVYLLIWFGYARFLGATQGVVAGESLIGRTAVVTLPCGPRQTGAVSIYTEGMERTYSVISKESFEVGTLVRVVRVFPVGLEVERTI